MPGPLSSEGIGKSTSLSAPNSWGLMHEHDAEVRRAKPQTRGNFKVGGNAGGGSMPKVPSARKRLRK